MSNYKNILIVCAILMGAGCSAAHKFQQNAAPVSLLLTPSQGNPRNSEGSFMQLRSGRIIFVYTHYKGTSGADHGNAVLCSRYSDDDGKTWSKNDEEVVGQEGLMNVMSVSLLRLQNGNIAMFYLRKNSLQDCIPVMRISQDEARTWSKPVDCVTDSKGYYVLNNDRVLQLKNGRIILPVARHDTGTDLKFKEGASVFTYFSDDMGATWNRSRVIPNRDSIVLQEPGIVTMSDGTLAMFIRTDLGHQYISYSKDNGSTWSQVKPWTLASPLSPASVKSIPGTKKLLAVWNNQYADKKRYKALRTPLTVAISVDNGKSWKKITDIEKAETNFCYTAIFFLRKHILLAYCSDGLTQTKITRLPSKYF